MHDLKTTKRLNRERERDLKKRRRSSLKRRMNAKGVSVVPDIVATTPHGGEPRTVTPWY